jgi:hypothetical protein
MGQKQPIRSLVSKIILCTAMVGLCLIAPGVATAQEGYPEGYTPSEPAAEGGTNVLARFAAVSTYMTDKLEAAGGNDSPICYRNCLTVPVNDILDCIEKNNTYETSESCELDAANKMAACDPKCQ